MGNTEKANDTGKAHLERFADLYIDRKFCRSDNEQEHHRHFRYLIENRYRYGANDAGIKEIKTESPYGWHAVFAVSGNPIPLPRYRNEIIRGITPYHGKFLGRIIFVDGAQCGTQRHYNLMHPVNAAIAVGALKPPKPQEILIAVDYEELGDYDEGFEQFLRDNFEVYADVRADDFIFRDAVFNKEEGWKYTVEGERPANLFVADLREDIIACADKLLKHCVSDITGTTGIETATRVLTAFGLGHGEFSRDATKAKSCAWWKKRIIKYNVTYTQGDAPILASLKEDAKFAEMVSEIWSRELKASHIIVNMPKFMKMSKEEANRLVREVANLLCVEDLMETYESGVPLEDILA